MQTIFNEAIVKLFILYRPDVALAENLAIRLKLNRKEKQLLIQLAKENVSIEDILNPLTLNKIIYNFEPDYAKAKLLTLVAANRSIPDNIWSIYSSIDSLPTHVFPIKGKDIIDAGFNDSQKLGEILKDLEQKWIDSDFSMSKENLLSELESTRAVV